MDSEGATESDDVRLVVRQGSQAKLIHHEFTLSFYINKKYKQDLYDERDLDWKLELMNRIAKFYGDGSPAAIQVLKADNGVFTWRNSSLSTSSCPQSEIRDLYEVSQLQSKI